MSEEPNYTDPEEFQKQIALGGGFNKDMLSFRFVLMTHMMRILAFGSKEWCGGYWKESEIVLPDGRILRNKTWETNTRQQYGNAVRTLYHLMEPKLWKINNKGEMEKNAFADAIIDAAKLAKEVSIKLELNTEENNKALFTEYIETHHDLFIKINRFADYNSYWSVHGIIQ